MGPVYILDSVMGGGKCPRISIAMDVFPTPAFISRTFTLQEAIMQEIMDWIDREVERLDRETMGEKTESTGQNSVPNLLKAFLGDCV